MAQQGTTRRTRLKLAIRSTAMAVLAGLFACKSAPQTPWPPMEKRYYVAEIAIGRSAVGEGTPQRVDRLADDANQLLRPGVRVALFPPDSCVTTTASPHGSEQAGYIQMQCGVLMSSLETRLAKAGYEVVSWQALKPAGGAAKAGWTAIDRAKELSVQILFEIDQLSANDRGAGQSRATGIRTFAQTSASDREPLPVPPGVAGNCKTLADSLAADLAPTEASATLAAKAVDVGSGRAIWYYQKTIAEELTGPSEISRNVYFEAFATRPPQPPPPSEHNGLQTLGGGLAIAGVVVGLSAGLPLTVVGNVVEDNDVANAGGTIALWSGVALGAGLALILAGNATVKADETPVPPTSYAPPDRTLCATAPVRPHFAQVASAAAEPPVAPAQASYQFKDQRAGDSDPQRERTERLFERTAADFVAELGKLAPAAR